MDRYEFIRNDAMVMERLTASPRIVDIYGHCGTSIVSEFLPGEVQEVLIPGRGRREKMHDKDDVDPKNKLTAEEKLYMALQMAESMADLHGFKDGVIVHDDIQLVQYLFVGDDLTMKLNDFNRAEVMLYDEHEGSYCRYSNGHGAGDYRSPEEYVDGLLNEKIDVWSLGNNIYALLTGLWIFYDEADDTYDGIQKKLKGGVTSYIDPR
jgi:serine/threonine protein kinase